jgi:hypothetical protein
VVELDKAVVAESAAALGQRLAARHMNHKIARPLPKQRCSANKSSSSKDRPRSKLAAAANTRFQSCRAYERVGSKN